MLHKRPNTYVLQARLSITHFASLCNAYKRKMPETHLTASLVAKMAMERLAEMLIEAGEADTYENYEEANQYMISIGMKKPGRQERVAPNILSSMDGSSIDLTAGYTSSETETEPGVLTPEEVMKRMEQLEKGTLDE